jgi:Domain of unknown function (DUF4307)
MTVTEIDASAPVYPPGRYGRRRERRRAGRGRVLALAGAGTLAGLLLAVVLYQRYTPEYRPQVVEFQAADDHVTLRFQVHKPSRDPAVCHVRARNRAGAEVGAANVAVPAGATVTVSYTLTTNGPPVTAEVPTCRKG